MSSTQTITSKPIMTHRQILFVIIALMSGMFLSALDQTVVSTSIRTIADDLNGLSFQAWVTTAYLITSTISTPIYGKLSDIFGRRPLFIIAISVFLLGSLLSGTSTNMAELAAYRGLQGLGAGGLMALPLAIMGDMLAPRERAKYQGFFLAVFGVSSLIGPLIGGLFAGSPEILWLTGWRWVFLINIPVGVVALAMVLRFLHLPFKKRVVRIDWWGTATVVTAIVPLLLVSEEGQTWGWTSLGSFACYIIGLASAIGFVFIERHMGDDALIPMKLFKSSTFSMATVLGVFVGFGMFGALTTIPLYLQLVQGATPTESGLLTLPMIVGLMISSIGSGQIIARTGRYKIFPILGTGLMATGFFYLTFITADKPVWYIMIGMFIIGLGLGQLMQTLTTASQNAVGPRDIGVATSSATFFRSMGGTLGTAILFSVLFDRIPTTLKAAFSNTKLKDNLGAALANPKVLSDPKNAQIIKLLQHPSSLKDALNGDTSFLNHATKALSEPFLTGFSNATVTVYWIGFVTLSVAFVLSFFLKATKLRQKSAMQEAADQDEAILAERAAEQMGAMVDPGTAATNRIPTITVVEGSA